MLGGTVALLNPSGKFLAIDLGHVRRPIVNIVCCCHKFSAASRMRREIVAPTAKRRDLKVSRPDWHVKAPASFGQSEKLQEIFALVPDRCFVAPNRSQSPLLFSAKESPPRKLGKIDRDTPWDYRGKLFDTNSLLEKVKALGIWFSHGGHS
jgi:hypothetical protein